MNVFDDQGTTRTTAMVSFNVRTRRRDSGRATMRDGSERTMGSRSVCQGFATIKKNTSKVWAWLQG
jgi:hypothetical protein